MSHDFYRAFEEKFRGSRALVLERLAVYKAFLAPLSDHYSGAPALDIGCGRGEWLELLLEQGFNAIGVDQDEGMLQSCRDLSLPAQQGDAVAYLSTLPDESHAVVSAFHVVEHISFDQLRTLVSGALRVLKPGGLLIMETPNPENIIVATRNFYLDPTHLRPIPPEFLAFLPEYYGFVRTKIMRLQESKELTGNSKPLLHDVLAGVSPDYAVVAQKGAKTDTMMLFDEVFEKEHGLTLDTLAARFDIRLQEAEMKAQGAEEKLKVIYSSQIWRLNSFINKLLRSKG